MKPYYESGGIQIFHGAAQEVLPQLEPVDLVLTDPPYGTEDLGGGYGRRQNHDPNGRHGRRIQGDKDLDAMAEAFLLLPLTSDAYVLTFCAARRMLEVVQICEISKLECWGEIIWDKGTPGLGYTIRYSHESCLALRKADRIKPIRPVMSIVRILVSRKNTHLKHPHEKPVGFWKHCCNLREGAILDPFMGSGSALLAAKDLGRKAIGIEIEERYAEIAARRLEQEVLQFPNDEVAHEGIQGSLLEEMEKEE